MEPTSPPTAHRPHPNYVAIFGWLTMFTVVEIGVSFMPLPKALQIGALVTIAAIKALLVVLYYMHLRYDSKWYSVILMVGIGFALLAGRFMLAISK